MFHVCINVDLVTVVTYLSSRNAQYVKSPLCQNSFLSFNPNINNVPFFFLFQFLKRMITDLI